jgi:hypothetical protein
MVSEGYVDNIHTIRKRAFPFLNCRRTQLNFLADDFPGEQLMLPPLPELETYLQPFTKLFRRSWSRQSCERYVTGLLTDLPHKNCDTIAALAGTSTERLQHLLTDADWDALALHQFP